MPSLETRWARAVQCRALGALCLLGLSAALSACSSSPDYGDDKNALRGVRTVSFDKNGGDTEAVPESMTLRPPATTVERLPEPPTRAGRTFLGWNTEKDGSGSPFTEQTPVTADILLIVYARWEAPSLPAPLLGIRLSPGAATLTPMPGERSVTVTVAVDGFRNEADASQVKLGIGLADVEGLSLKNVVPSHTPNSKTVHFTVEYDFEKAFDKTPVLLSLGLENIPQGYEYVGGPQTLRVDIFDGLEKSRPIPVHGGNIRVFNDYADTNEGLKLHYQLVENVELTPPEAGKNNWTAIGKSAAPAQFVGSFDGGGHTISNLTIRAPDNTAQGDHQGMFGYISPGAELKDLGLEGVNVTGRDCVGALVGMNWGTVHKSYATGSVRGADSTGGLVGWNNGAVHNSYATGSVNGRFWVGGLVGFNRDGSVHNNYATGSVIGTDYVGGLLGGIWGLGGTVRNSYATGSVKGDAAIGGLVGYNNGAVRNSVALSPSVIAIAIDTNIGRVVGRNHAALSGNHARNNMKLELGEAPYEPTPDTAWTDKNDGAGTSAFNTRDFWTKTLSSWGFSEDGAWEWQEGFLPLLRGVGGEQEPRVQEVP